MDLDQLAAAAMLARGRGRGASMRKGGQECQVMTSKSELDSGDSARILYESSASVLGGKTVTRSHGLNARESGQDGVAIDQVEEDSHEELDELDELDEQDGQEHSILDSAAASALQAFTSGARSSSSAPTYHCNPLNEPSLPSLTFDKNDDEVDRNGDVMRPDASSDSSTAHSTPECSSSYKEGLFDDQLPLHSDGTAINAVSSHGQDLSFTSISRSSASPQLPYDFHSEALQVPPKKQKGRRPAAAGMDLKNHKCPHLGCAWSFSVSRLFLMMTGGKTRMLTE